MLAGVMDYVAMVILVGIVIGCIVVASTLSRGPRRSRTTNPQLPLYTFEQWLAMDADTRDALLGYELQHLRAQADQIAASADAAAWLAFWIALE